MVFDFGIIASYLSWLFGIVRYPFSNIFICSDVGISLILNCKWCEHVTVCNACSCSYLFISAILMSINLLAYDMYPSLSLSFCYVSSFGIHYFTFKLFHRFLGILSYANHLIALPVINCSILRYYKYQLCRWIWRKLM